MPKGEECLSDRCGGGLLFLGERQSSYEKRFRFPWETSVQALSSCGHVYSFSIPFTVVPVWSPPSDRSGGDFLALVQVDELVISTLEVKWW